MTVVAAKIYDHNCENCSQMSRFDESVFLEFAQVDIYIMWTVDELLSLVGEHALASHVFSALDRYGCNPDYTLDLPTYILINGEGKYLGHLKGAIPIADFRKGVKEILVDSTEAV